MLNLSKTLLAATFASLLLVGCEKDDDDTRNNPNEFPSATDNPNVPTESSPSQELVLAFKSGIDVEAEGGNFEFSFSSNKSWSVTTEQEWCKAVPDKGDSGDVKFSVCVSPNESWENREAILTFRTGDFQDYIHIRQQGQPIAHINVAKAGTLKEMVGENEKHLLEFHISGDINGDDIDFLQNWSRYAKSFNPNDLKILDMGKANIVDGGSYFYAGDLDKVQRMAKANTISDYMFYGSAFLKELILPQTVTTIEDNAVLLGNYLTKLVLPEKLETVGNHSVFGAASKIEELIIPEHLSSVGEYSFFGFENVTELKLPAELRNIGTLSFSDFKKVKRLIIPDGVEKLDNSFRSWDNLEYVRLPATLKEIAGLNFMVAFDSESSIEIHLSSVTPPKSDYISIYNQNITIYVPQGGLENYRNDEEWGKFKNIIEE